MTRKIFHSTMDCFVGAGELPIWVVYRRKGVHPARFFHDHNYSEIAVIISGPARHVLDGENIPVAAGDVLIIHPGAVHAYDETAEMEIVNLIFDPSRLSLPQLDGYSMPLFGKIFPDAKNLYHSANPAAHLNPEDLAETVRMIRKLEDELETKLFERTSRSVKLTVAGELFLKEAEAVLQRAELARQRKSGEQNSARQANFRIGDAIRYMNRHYAEPVELKILAKIANMSERSFFRHFHVSAGCSPVEYLLKIRLQHGCDLLINGNASIAEIAAECGFCDSNYFCKQFRRAFSVSPRTFRRSYRNS